LISQISNYKEPQGEMTNFFISSSYDALPKPLVSEVKCKEINKVSLGWNQHWPIPSEPPGTGGKPGGIQTLILSSSAAAAIVGN
jgi:hypothetical protein